MFIRLYKSSHPFLSVSGPLFTPRELNGGGATLSGEPTARGGSFCGRYASTNSSTLLEAPPRHATLLVTGTNRFLSAVLELFRDCFRISQITKKVGVSVPSIQA
ncbi:hypothetical protein J6590_039250 [Homalodisca vitripennis]|nr:hypothetical protein J6590_039250 [Homalodisca vitripennis]